MILIDGGDFGESTNGINVWKTAELFKAMRALGYDAIGLGERDLAAVLFEEIDKNGGKEILLSGNSPPAVAIGVAPIRLIHRQSFKVGVVEVISPFLQSGHAADTKGSQAFLSEHLATLQNKKADVLGVIYHGPASEVLALRESLPKVDFWLLSHSIYQPLNQVSTTDGALVVGPGDRGRELGFIVLQKGINSGTRSATFTQIILDSHISDSPRVAPFRDSFRMRRQTAAPVTHQQAQSASLLNPYVGSEVCNPCHTEIYDKWHDTRHASAFETLVANSQSTSPECLRCHTVGYGEPTGYDGTDGKAHLTEVGCEACHGRGGYHVRANGQYANFLYPNKSTCLRCHNQETSPKFVYEEFVTRVH